MALSSAGTAAAAPAPGNGTEANLLYSVDNGATWSSSVTAQRGQTVTARLFYDTTKTTDVTDASLTTQIPAGFTYVPGSTRNVLAPQADMTAGTAGSETKLANVDNSVWTGTNLQVSPSAGFNGESNSSQTGILRTGLKRYLNLDECTYTHVDPGINDYTTRLIGTGAFAAGTNVSNTADTAAGCGDGSGTVYTDLTVPNLRNLELLGNQYLNLEQCVYTGVAAGSTVNNFDDRVVGNGDRLSGTDTSNSARDAAPCGPGGESYIGDSSTIEQAIPLVGNRYLNIEQCVYVQNDGTNNLFDTRWVGNTRARSANTNASNTPETAATCNNTSGAYDDPASSSSVKALDLVDTTRGTGYIQFAFTSTVPTCGTSPAVPSTKVGTLNGTGTGTPASSASITLAAATAGPCAPPVISLPSSNSMTTGLPTITGTGAVGDTVTVTDETTDDVICADVPVAGDGSWSCTSSEKLSEGNHIIHATQAPAGGVASAVSNKVSFTSDGTPLFASWWVALLSALVLGAGGFTFFARKRKTGPTNA